MNGRVLTVWIVVLALVRSGAWGDELIDPAHSELVRQLGAPEFSKRQAAEQKLLRVGAPAKAALRAGRRDEDMEIRLASQRILICLAQRESDELTESFLDGDNSVSLDRFPGWPRLRDRLGDRREVRRLYIRMFRAELELLQSLERNDPELLDNWRTQLQTQESLATPEAHGGMGMPSGSSLCALLFVGVEIADESQDAYWESLQMLSQFLLTRLDDQQMARLGMHEPLIRQLLASWADALGQVKNRGQIMHGLLIALKFELPELGCRLARSALQEGHEHPNAKPYAAITLGRFGTVEDAQFLIPHLQDTRVFHTWSNPQLQKDPILIQVRDVMLAMLLRMRGRDPATCGFELLEPSPETLYHIWTFGFLQESQRVAAFEKWQPVAEGKASTEEKPAASPAASPGASSAQSPNNGQRP
jgi:hypothetical protein